MWFGFGLGRLDRFWFGNNTTTLPRMALCSPGRTVSCPSVFRDQTYDWVENEPPSLPSPAPTVVPSDPGPHPGRARESDESSGPQTPPPSLSGPPSHNQCGCADASLGRRTDAECGIHHLASSKRHPCVSSPAQRPPPSTKERTSVHFSQTRKPGQFHG